MTAQAAKIDELETAQLHNVDAPLSRCYLCAHHARLDAYERKVRPEYTALARGRSL